MWAIPVEESKGLFKLESIPFYGPSIASYDIFLAEHDEQEKMLTFREVREHFWKFDSASSNNEGSV